MVQYGANVNVSSPDWVVKQVKDALRKPYDNYVDEKQTFSLIQWRYFAGGGIRKKC
ncbi:hypothetical protein H6F32_16610 [Anabaena sp. FACHB-1237]|uniref:hypothetical protein n=1 Tax=Anabaena sp. FACHB-1237 TaxID=2692769 RepID=UPI0016812FF5|nr:hypothetical protein [Anabaena sp. FACHB-1237]MBD2139155.1 hypothetical protein [Anabaena sp. FACHB-1237]